MISYSEILSMHDNDITATDVENIKVGDFVKVNDTITRVFFNYKSKKYKLLTKITIRWKNGRETSISCLDTDEYKVRINGISRKLYDLQVGDKNILGENNMKGKVIKREHTVARPIYIFTESGRIIINCFLIYNRPRRLLRHTRYTSRISRLLVHKRLLIGLERAL